MCERVCWGVRGVALRGGCVRLVQEGMMGRVRGCSGRCVSLR